MSNKMAKLVSIFMVIAMMITFVPQNLSMNLGSSSVGTASAENVIMPKATSGNATILGVGEKRTISVTYKYSGKFSLSNNNVVSMGERILGDGATGGVKTSYVVTAKAVGTTNLIYTARDGAKATITIKVYPAPKTMELNRTAVKIGIGDTYQIKPIFNGTANGSVSYVSSNTRVASIDKNSGKVTAKAVGVTKITATSYNGLKANCTVTVAKAPEYFKVSSTAVTINTNQKYTLKVSCDKGAAGSYTYSSSNPKVATVKWVSACTLEISPIAAGTATITVTSYNGKTTKCKVTVKNAPAITVERTCGVGEVLTIKTTIPSGTYKSTNTNVVTVNKVTGKATCKSIGKADIIYTPSKGSKEITKITVKAKPKTMTLNYKGINSGVGDIFIIKPVFNTNAGGSVTYKSSNTNVVTINAKGTVNLKAKGSAVITATSYNGLKASCKVTVVNAPKSINLSKTSLTLDTGKKATLSISFNAGMAGSYTYASSNPKVAKVKWTAAKTLEVTAVSAGTANITVTSYNGKTATCKVTVKSVTPKYRAIIVCSMPYDYPVREEANMNTYLAVNNFIKSVTGTKFNEIYSIKDPQRADDVFNAISKVANEAGENDVTFFFYAGHGNKRVLGLDSIYVQITAQELRSHLDTIQGKKIVFLDCCQSGGFINKGATKSDLSDSANYAEELMAAFIGNQPKSSDNLVGNNYFVMTSSTKDQYTYLSTSKKSRKGHKFSIAWLTGCGYDYQNGKFTGKLPADANNDKKITLNELYQYTYNEQNRLIELSRPYIEDDVYACVYPANSN